jgi:serine/threonine protein kinase/tetratricopeptide (TPR) repeat protein
MVGKTLGHYQILEKLGSGGMGTVYRAADLRLGRQVAIKVLHEEPTSDPERLRRFELEARSASALNHPNIVHIYEIDVVDTVHYIVMELVEGVTLREVLAGGPLSIKRVLQIGGQIADGLAKAHEARIVHRDLKPENLMVTREGYIKILDFGLAKLMPAPDVASAAETLSRFRTRDGVVVGTLAYMSPEQARGASVDHRSDQFSLGTILYEMVTGNRAFHRATGAQTLSAIIEAEPEPLPAKSLELPPELMQVMKRCLAKNPEDRYWATHDLAREIAGILPVERPDVAGDDGPQEPARSVVSRRRWAYVASALGLLFLGSIAALRLGGWRDELSGTERMGIDSVAVLPLENLSGNTDEEYFVDGMTEALIAALAQAGDLKVISRTSVMQFKGVKANLREIARQLGVEAVVEGSALRVGNRVRITVQLIDAATDRHLWADSYERDFRDVLSLQSDVALAIAKEIEGELVDEETGRLTEARPRDPKALDLFLQGVFYFNSAINQPTIEKRLEPHQKSFDYLSQAIAIEPDFSEAYAALSRSHHWLASVGFPEHYHLAKSAALRALEIDEKNAVAHGALAYILANNDWEWTGAERHYLRALELSNGSHDHHGYALYLSAMGRHPQAIEAIRKAEELDPLTVSVKGNKALIYANARDYERALASAQITLELLPGRDLTRRLLGLIQILRGSYDEGIRTLEELAATSPDSGEDRANTAFGHALAGRKEKASLLLERLKHQEKDSRFAYAMARAYGALGKNDDAFRWLDVALESRETGVFLGVDPTLDSLRSDARFDAALHRVHLR